jgi:hypothetical protein
MNPQIARLRAIHRLETGNEMDEYDELIGQLAREEPLDPLQLPDLLLTFFDDTEQREVMWGLVHHVEDYPAALYVSRLVETLPEMIPQAHEWALLLLRRVLNAESDRLLLQQAYRAQPMERQPRILGLLRELVLEDPSAAPLVDAVTAP